MGMQRYATAKSSVNSLRNVTSSFFELLSCFNYFIDCLFVIAGIRYEYPKIKRHCLFMKKPYQLVHSFLQPLIGCSFQNKNKRTAGKDRLYSFACIPNSNRNTSLISQRESITPIRDLYSTSLPRMPLESQLKSNLKFSDFISSR